MRIISTTVTEEDYRFIKQRNLKFATLIRERLYQIKELVTPEITDSLKAANAKVKRMLDTLTKQSKFLDKKGLLLEFNKIE